jgi:ABC-type nitrate/sulfonate/bicarbonate transport system substrate-binding protein
LGLIVVALGLVSCGSPRLEKVVFQLDWTHETEFLGLYVAQDQGFFRQAGLDVDLVEGPAGTDIPGILASGQADIAQMGLTMFLEANRIHPEFRAVMAVFQISPRVILTAAGAGITNPKGLEGKTLGVKSASWAQLVKRIMTNAGADPQKLKTVPVRASDIDKFYRGEVDAWTGFASSEPVESLLAGHPVNLIFADDFGVGGYDELVVVRSDALTKDKGSGGRSSTRWRKGGPGPPTTPTRSRPSWPGAAPT